MPRGVAKNPDTDKRHTTKSGGRPPILPPDTHVWHVRVTWTEREALANHLATIRAAWARKRAGQQAEATKEAEETKETDE